MRELWLVIVMAILVIFATSVSLLKKKKREIPNSPIFALAGALAVVGITFSDYPLVGYSFLGTSMALSVLCVVGNLIKKSCCQSKD